MFRCIEDEEGSVALSRKDLEPFGEGEALGVTGKEKVRIRDALCDGLAGLPVCQIGSGIGAEVARITHVFRYGAHFGTFLCRQVGNGMVFGIYGNDIVGNKELHRRYGRCSSLRVCLSHGHEMPLPCIHR